MVGLGGGGGWVVGVGGWVGKSKAGSPWPSASDGYVHYPQDGSRRTLSAV